MRANPSIRTAVPSDHASMLALWERSVRATHGFLSSSDIADLLPQVAAGFEAPAIQWWVTVLPDGHVVGFLGYASRCIEALFVDPAYHRQGLGRQLVQFAQQLAQGPLRLDVNEGNPGAVAFYRGQGFAVVGRSEVDGQGRPFPLLHMEQKRPAST